MAETELDPVMNVVFAAILTGFFVLMLMLLLRMIKVLFSGTRKTISTANQIFRKSRQAIGESANSKEARVLRGSDQLYEIAAREIETGTQDRGLWIKTLALSEGDERKQKAKYILLRVQRLEQHGGARIGSQGHRRPTEELEAEREPKPKPKPKPERPNYWGLALAVMLIIVVLWLAVQ